MSSQPYAYDLLAVLGLDHLPTPTSLTVSRMRGGNIPGDREQYYINTTYRIPDSSVGGGLRRTTGFSVQRQDIPGLVEMLTGLYEGKGDLEPLFACERCSSENGIVHHARREGCSSGNNNDNNNNGGGSSSGSGSSGQPQPADDDKAGDDEPSGGFIL